MGPIVAHAYPNVQLVGIPWGSHGHTADIPWAFLVGANGPTLAIPWGARCPYGHQCERRVNQPGSGIPLGTKLGPTGIPWETRCVKWEIMGTHTGIKWGGQMGVSRVKCWLI